MDLIIVESPTKAKTISKFLSDDFIVQSSFGHIRDLPKSELGIDLEHDFTPKYIIPIKAKKHVTALKKTAASAETVILATDEDREGEAIAWHLVQALGLGQHAKNIKIQRIVFHEITKNAIHNALKNPRDISQNLVDAQQARRILDRLVGYKLSPILWKRYYRGLSAGRVQSVAVRLIVEREREIEKFVSEEYWTITANVKSQKSQEPFSASLIGIGDKNLEKLSIKTEENAQKIVDDLKDAQYIVQNVEKKNVTRSPFPPFTTSTLQQSAAKRLKFSSKQTMMIAQQLYEGIGSKSDDSIGLITYMRTDSVHLSEDSIAGAQSYITDTFGQNYAEQRRYKTKTKSAQEAHEAIRPTDPARVPESIRGHLTPQQYKIYDLIWRRFVASQMAKAMLDATTIEIDAKQYRFKATGTTMKFDGFLKVYPTKFEENKLPSVSVKEELQLQELIPEQHFTKPPSRYNEASLIKLLEQNGIGRPSTYAPIISTILMRKYVIKDRSRYFHPTDTGTMVNDFLVKHFKDIVDVKFTSHMEEELDEIATGKMQWIPVVREFYEPFSEQLREKYETAKEEKAANTEFTDKVCDKCGNKMIVRHGRFGKFIACSDYPKCKNILKEEKDKPKKTGEKCEKCGNDMVMRSGRFGEFMACSNYPECKNTKKIEKNKTAT